MPSRRAVLSLCCVSLAGCTELSDETDEQPEPDSAGSRSFSWPSVNAGSDNTRAVPDGAVYDLEPEAQTRFPDGEMGIQGSNARAPVIDDGKLVLVAPSAEDDEGCLVTCLETETESDWLDIDWQQDLGRRSPDGGAVIDGDLAFVPASDQPGVSSDGDGLLVALSMADGNVEWSHPLEDGPGFTPVVRDGTAYVRSTDGINAIDVETGDLEWRDGLPTIERARQRNTHIEHIGPAVDDDRVYVPGADELAVYDRNGEFQWDVSLPEVAGAPAVANGAVYICADGELHALETEDGSSRWTETNVRSIGPAVGDDEIVVVSSEGTVKSLEPSDGSERWENDGLSDSQEFFAPTIVGETVITNSTSTITGLALEDGSRRWVLEGFASRWHLAIANGRVYQFSDQTEPGSDDDTQLVVFDRKTAE